MALQQWLSGCLGCSLVSPACGTKRDILTTIVLAISLFFMDNQRAGTSWHCLADAVKYAISIWPIVFAAVTTQGLYHIRYFVSVLTHKALKSFAVWKIERGIKLIHLEQLIGSTGFGSTLKQPYTLRSLNLLAVGLFLFWCLSPLGSQALVRVYRTDFDWDNSTTLDISWVDTTGNNQLFSSGISQEMTNSRSDTLQLVSAYFNSMFLPPTEQAQQKNSKEAQDIYENPMIPAAKIPPSDVLNDSSAMRLGYTSAFGVPWIYQGELDASSLSSGSNSFFDIHTVFNFTLDASYYELSCSDWSVVKYGDLPGDMYLSDMKSIGLAVGQSPNPNSLKFASQNRNLSIQANTAAGGVTDAEAAGFEYSLIHCNFTRVLVNVTYLCTKSVKTSAISGDSSGTAPTCSVIDRKTIPTPLEWQLGGLNSFSQELIEGTTIGSADYLISPSMCLIACRILTNG
jgi:hypothetical protein